MKKCSKVLLAFLAVAVLTLAVALTAVADAAPNYTGTVSDANGLLTAAQSLSGEEKGNALSAVGAYLKANPVDPAADGYADFSAAYGAEVIAYAGTLLDAVDAAEGLARTGISINKVKAFLKKQSVDPTLEGLGEINQRLSEAVEAHAAARAEARAQIATDMDLAEFDLPTNLESDFNTTTPTLNAQNKVPSDSTTAFAGYETKADGDNRYATVRHDGNVAGHCYVGWNIGTATKGFVFEFDLTTFGELPAFSLVENGSLTPAGATSYIYPTYFGFDSDGNIKDTANSKVYLADAIVPGEWLHLALCFNPYDYTYSIYVEDELIATFSSMQNGYKFVPKLLRFGRNNVSGEFSIDNIDIYQGTVIRDKDYLENLEGDEAFRFYCDFLGNENNQVNARMLAYDSATELISAYYDLENESYLTEDAKLRAAVDKYLAFDYEAIYNNYITENLAQYKSLVDSLTAIERSPETVGNRKTELDRVNEFIKNITAANGEIDILQNDEYREYSRKVSEASTTIDADNAISSFNRYMARFVTATTFVAMQRHYNAARQIVEEGLDVAVLSGPYADNFSDFAQYYEDYLAADELLAEATRDNNAKTIIGCVDIISEYTTEEQWQANYDYIESYLLIIRRLIKENNYNSSYVGFTEAMDTYNFINAYFYHQLQLQHAEVISGMLEKYASTDSYAERMGICAYINAFLSSNDIDFESEVIAPLVVRYETYAEEVESQQGPYGQILIQNSYYFINLVNEIQTKSGYSELKPLLDQAYVLYFAIDATVEGTEEAIAVFDKLYAQMQAIEDSSAKFIAAVALVETAETATGRYQRLVDAAYYSVEADDDIEGVAAAREIYTASYNAYNETIAPANAELASAEVVIGTLRSNKGPNAMVAIIMKKVFGW